MALRGRPKKPYPELKLHSEFERLVAADPGQFEWLGRGWLTAYRKTFPDAYDRMREKFAGQKTWAIGTLARKKRNEVSGLTNDEVDMLNFERSAGGRKRNRKGK